MGGPRPPHPPFPPKNIQKYPVGPQRYPQKNFVRPIPVHMAQYQASYKQPVVVPRPHKYTTPFTFPSAIWKNPTSGYRPPVEKPFISSPPPIKPYDFINNEPTLSVTGPLITNTIKQVGEKGPIHTIPAPKLSPADKPANIQEVPPKSAYQFKEYEISPNSLQSNIPQALPLIQPQLNQQPQSFHQYQVNEFHNDQPNGEKSYFAPDPDQKFNYNQLNIQSDLSNFATAANILPQSFGTPQPSILAAQHNIVSPPGVGVLSHQELVQIINSIPQQHLVDSYGTPLVQQPQLQQHFMQQAHQSAPVPVSTNNQQFFQSDLLSHIQSVPQSVKDNFKPQFHTFNYEEQSRSKPIAVDFAQSRVTGDFNLEPETSENNPSISIQSPNEALAQTQYVQQYFTNSDDINVNENNVETEGQTDKEATRILSQLASAGEVSPNMFYSTLPNREAAEALASLQAAGSINSNLMSQQPQQNDNKMRIYVPDDESEEMETSGENDDGKDDSNGGIKIYETFVKSNLDNHKSKDSVEYDESKAGEFGSRIKAKHET